MVRSIAHIGIAVQNLDNSVKLFERLFGVAPGHPEEVEDQGVRTVLFAVGGSGVELLEPTRSDSPVAKFLEARGEGVHHVSFMVDDLRTELARLQQQGFELVDHAPRKGAGGTLVAFLHPRSTNRVLVELTQADASPPSKG